MRTYGKQKVKKERGKNYGWTNRQSESKSRCSVNVEKKVRRRNKQMNQVIVTKKEVAGDGQTERAFKDLDSISAKLLPSRYYG